MKAVSFALGFLLGSLLTEGAWSMGIALYYPSEALSRTLVERRRFRFTLGTAA